MKTLFSPVGTADPITRLGDGPMLHIVRHERPDRVVLYLSQKMKGYQDRDQRFTTAIERMCESEGRPVPMIELRDNPEEQVFRFDYYISVYEDILKELSAENGEEPVLLNVSSGTPAMEQALVALGSFGHMRLKMLQVPTPRGDANKQGDREKPETYDLDFMHEYNEELRRDDPKTRESRIIEVETPNFAARLTRDNVKTLVASYDYEAAFELACGCTGVSKDARHMILAVRDRINMHGARSESLFTEGTLAYNGDLLSEHLSVMEVRLAQGHWADFMLLLSPAFSTLADEALAKHGFIKDTILQKDDDGTPNYKLDWEAIRKEERVKQVLDSCVNTPHTFSNDVRIKLLDEFCPDKAIRRKFGKLRTAESRCRNKLAHSLQASDKQVLERLAGMQLSTIMQYLFELYEYLHGDARHGLYDMLNAAIITKL